jgi:hypothetical protein
LASLAIHQDVRNDIVEADFRFARDYIKYSKSKIVAKLPNTFWYYATMSFNGYKLLIGKSRSSKIERIVSPTAPVAPTTQTLNFLLIV